MNTRRTLGFVLEEGVPLRYKPIRVGRAAAGDDLSRELN